MKCPTCVAEGKRSRVYPGVSMSTTMSGQSFYDEDGRFHDHNPNQTTTNYSCSNEHQWVVTERTGGGCWCEHIKDVEVGPEEAPPVRESVVVTSEDVGTLPRSIFDSMESLLGYTQERKK